MKQQIFTLLTILTFATKAFSQCATHSNWTLSNTTAPARTGTTATTAFLTGDVLQLCVTITSYNQTGNANWLHGVFPVSLPAGFTVATTGATPPDYPPMDPAGYGWISYAIAGNTGWYWDDGDGDPTNNFGDETINPNYVGTFCFAITVGPVTGTLQFTPTVATSGDGVTGANPFGAGCIDPGTPMPGAPTGGYFYKSPAPQPINLIAYTGNVQNGNAVLNWQTNKEINIAGYVLEKSKDGIEYNYLANINAKGGNGSNNNYNYVDYNFLNTNYYYRLFALSTDNKKELLGIVQLSGTVKDIQLLSIKPNPTRNSAKIYVYATQQDACSYTLTNVLGHVVLKGNYGLQKHVNEINLDMSNLPNGIYSLQLKPSLSAEIITTKILKN